MRDFGAYFDYLRNKEKDKIREAEVKIESINTAEEQYNLAGLSNDKVGAKRTIEELLASNNGFLSPLDFFKSLIKPGWSGSELGGLESQGVDSIGGRGEVESLGKFSEREGVDNNSKDDKLSLNSVAGDEIKSYVTSLRFRDKKVSKNTWSTSSVLATLGVFLLATGLSVFTAVKWSSLTGLEQLSIILVLNIVSLVSTRYFYHRSNYVIAETLSWLTAAISGITMLAAIRFNLVGEFSNKVSLIYVSLTVGLCATLMALKVVKNLVSPVQQSVFAYSAAAHFFILQFSSELKPIIYLTLAIVMISVLNNVKIKKYVLLAAQIYLGIALYYLFTNGFNSSYTTVISIAFVLMLYLFANYIKKIESLAFNSASEVKSIFNGGIYNLLYGLSAVALLVTLFALLSIPENTFSSIMIYATALYLFYGLAGDNLIIFNSKKEVTPQVLLFVIAIFALCAATPSIVSLKAGVENSVIFLTIQLLIVLLVIKAKKYFYIYSPLLSTFIAAMFFESKDEVLLFSGASLLLIFSAGVLSKVYSNKAFIFILLYTAYSANFLLEKISVSADLKTFIMVNILLVMLYLAQKLYRGDLIIVKSSLISTGLLIYLFYSANFPTSLETYNESKLSLAELLIPQSLLALYISAAVLVFRKIYVYKNIFLVYSAGFLTVSLISALAVVRSVLGENILLERYTTEFFTIPISTLWLLLALYGLRKTKYSSLILFLPVAVILLVPTLLLTLVYNDANRFLFIIVVSVGLVLYGVKRALQAPIIYGGVSTFLAALTQLLPYVNGLPRWLSLTLLGLILLYSGIRVESLKLRGVGIKNKVSEFR
jgi:hypothetical protein